MRNIPEDNLAYPVLIILSSGHSGSGFQLNSGTHIYLVTAKHVLFDNNGQIKADNAEIICQTRSIDDDTTTVFNINFNILNQSNNIFVHAHKDVAAFTIGTITENKDGMGYTTNLITGVTVKQTGKSEIVSVAKNTVIHLKDALVSNDIFLYGYPSSLGLKQSPQFDYSKPLLRKGIIASVNRTQGTIILDCPVYYGNSGGPVVQVTNDKVGIKHSVVGVVSQFIPYTENWVNQSNNIVHTEMSNSGYSVAVAMDYVFEMLNIK